ncbi:MAG: ABC transporter permease [Bacteroidota bacterium]
MFKNHLKTAWRNLLKNRGYFSINIFGLFIALTASFLMLLWVYCELNTDTFHKNEDRLFLVKRTIPLEEGVFDVYQNTAYPLLKNAKEQLPEVEQFLPVGFSFEDNLKIENIDYRATGTFANADYFSGFSFPVIQGDIQQLDQKPEAIAISERLAERIWGNSWTTTAIGKNIHILDNGDFIVEAVFQNLPASSSIQNDFYYSFEKHLKDNEWMMDWGNNGMQGVLVLKDGANPKLVAEKLNTLFQENISGENKEGCFLQKFSDSYLYGKFDEQAQVAGGRIEYVRIFSAAALFLLLVSCINFINLSTVSATKRAGEIGIRKVVGARKKVLITQFFTETAIITTISFALAIVSTLYLLPQVSDFVGKDLHVNLSTPIIWIALLSLFLLTTLFSGGYPAIVISSFQPIKALKGNSREKKGAASFRKGLVVFQFGLTILLIVAAIIVKLQVDYINTKDLGIARNNIVSIHQDEALTNKYSVLRHELLSKNAVEDVTLVGPSPLDIRASSSGVVWPKKTVDQENIEFALLWTAHNFPEVFNVPLVQGNYYRETSVDTVNVVINQKAAAIMALTDPVGKTIQVWGDQRQIIGVVKDFHNTSLYEPIQPTVFFLDPNDAGTMFVKFREGKTQEGLANLDGVFQKVLPDLPLHYAFLDQEYAAIYRTEVLTGKLTYYFAWISILVSCLGLFGLASFIAKQRTKEIGIRKVLGASVKSITSLISKDFLKLVALAVLVASPIAYYLMQNWLSDFTYRIDISGWIFVFTGILTLGIALITISFQAIRAAIIDPVKSLRTE